jgi:hypothetical protein
MGKLFGLFGGLMAYVCIASVISLGVLVVVAKSKGYLAPERVAKMLAVARGEEIAPAATAATSEQGTKENTKTEPSFQFQDQQYHIRELQIKLREEALKKERDNLADERNKLTKEVERFERDQDLYKTQLKNEIDSKIQEGRAKVEKIWEMADPAQTKLLMAEMIKNREINEVAAIFSMIPDAKQAKIIAEFSSPEDIVQLDELLKLIRVPPSTINQGAKNASTP